MVSCDQLSSGSCLADKAPSAEENVDENTEPFTIAWHVSSAASSCASAAARAYLCLPFCDPTAVSDSQFRGVEAPGSSYLDDIHRQ